MADKFNPRFVQFCRYHRTTPEAMLEKIDRDETCMGEFIIWIGERIAEFRIQHPEHFIGYHISNHAEFDNYIESYVNAHLESTQGTDSKEH